VKARVLPPVSLCLFGLTSCLGATLSGKVDGTQTQLQRAIRDGSKTIGCAPKETAIAEANIKFAHDALRMGEYYRGKDHADSAEAYTKLAIAKTDPVKCREGTQVSTAVPRVGDRDGDGYDDKVDKCPDEAEDFDSFEDDDGCPDTDNDKDGVLDAAQFKDGRWINADKLADKDCRNDPEDKDDFQDEDGCPDPDNDKDGILDKDDKCPNDPEDFDQFEDEDGCPDPDNDQDKILDKDDKCPNDPEDYDGVEDTDGCPDLMVKDEGDRIATPTIYFKFDKWDIDPKSYPVLDDLVTLLKQKSTIELLIGGHTDSKGSDKYNKTLSQKRVDSVRNYLIRGGVDTSRLKSVGYGEEQPIDSNRSPEGRARNRRVEFLVTKR